jgi:3-deoxy-D-manno-octulosonic acid kinase
VTAGTEQASAGTPPGYRSVEQHGARVTALPGALDEVLAALWSYGTVHEWAAAQPGAEPLAGRGTAYAVSTADGEWVVRHYRRGGAVAGLLGDRYLRVGESRAEAELAVSVEARSRGVASPEVVAAVVRNHGVWYRADLVTRRIVNAASLADITLGTARAGTDARAAAWHAAGWLLRDIFDGGLEHADLNLRNILVRALDTGSPSAVVLDLDRAVVRPGAVGHAGQAAMLSRLHRSRRKLERLAGSETSQRELDAFAAGLAGGQRG